MATKPPATLTAALDLVATRGWHVFPADLSDGQKKSHKAAKYSNGRPWGATNDPEEIRRDFTRWSAAGVGIPTGAVNNIIVVDLDTLAGHGRDGVAAMKELEAVYGALPETLQVVTPSDGSHLYFQSPPDVVIRSSTSKVGIGIDIIGEGGMVLAPPTVRPGSGAYRWANDKAPAVMPGWLITLAHNANKFVGDAAANPELTTEPEIAAAAMAVIPNDDVNWGDWNRIGMACWCATGGSDEGLAAFDTWSQKSGKYNAATTRKRWEDYKRSPPNRIGAGTLNHLANEADPDWGRRYDVEVKAKMDAANANARMARRKSSGTSSQEQEASSQEQEASSQEQEASSQEQEASSQENNEPPKVLILELASKLWGPGQRISNGQWRFGDVAVDAWRARWFDLKTNTYGGIDELMRMLGNGGSKQQQKAELCWHGEQTARVSRPALIKNLLPATGVALISGQWAAGKTFLALDLAGDIMLNTRDRFIDYRIKRHGGVLFIAAEGVGSIGLRLNVMLADKLGQQQQSIPQPFAWVDCQPNLLHNGAQELIELAEQASEKMRNEFNCDLVLIIVDTIAAAAAFQDENDAAQAQKIMGALGALSKATGALVIGCDHFGKDVTTGTRGSSAKEGYVESILALVGERELTGKMTNLKLGVRKVRDGETGRKIPFRLQVIDCGVDEDGDQVTTCAIRWEPERSTAGKSGRPAMRRGVFGEALAAALADAGETIANGKRAVRKQIVVMKFKEMYTGKTQDLNTAFRKAYKDALIVGEVESCKSGGVDWLWPSDEPL